MEVKRIVMKEARDFLAMFHYLGSVKGGAKCYGLFVGESIVGVACFVGEELSRFALAEGAQKNAASHALALSTRRYFVDHPESLRVFSFADGGVGHVGVIYKAAGWKLVERRTSIMLVAGDGEREERYSGKYCLERAFSKGVREGRLEKAEKLRFEVCR